MGTQAQGSNAQIIIEDEVTFKTKPVAGNAIILPFVSESLRMSRNLLESNSITSQRNARQPVRGNQEAGGEITLELSPQMGRIIKHVLGTVSTTGANPYSHTFKVSALPTGLYVEKGFTDLDTPEYFQYTGCKINSFSLTAKAEGFIETRVNFMGAGETISTSSFDGTPTDLGHTPFDGFGCSIEENGSSLGVATEIDFTIENNLDGSSYVIGGAGVRYSIPAGIVKVSGTLHALFDSMTLYNRAINNTETNILLTLIKGTGTGTSGNEKLTIKFPEVLLSPQSPVINGPQGVLVELPFQAYYNDSGEASSVYMVLYNAIATN
jgi:hypothetical protein